MKRLYATIASLSMSEKSYTKMKKKSTLIHYVKSKSYTIPRPATCRRTQRSLKQHVRDLTWLNESTKLFSYLSVNNTKHVNYLMTV